MKLILGTANLNKKYGLNFKNNPSKSEFLKILEYSKKKITYIDYSDEYSSFLKFDIFKDFKIIFKLRLNKKNNLVSHVELIKIITNKLKKKNLKKVDTIMFHRSHEIYNLNKKTLKNVIAFLKKNICNKIGVSIYEPSELNKIYKLFKPDVIQCPFNIFDKRVYKSGWLKKAKLNGAKIQVRSVFLQGLLFRNVENLPSRFFKHKKFFKKIDLYITKKNIKKIDLYLNDLKLYKKFIDYVVIGVLNLNQLKEINTALKKKIIKNNIKFKKVPKQLYDPREW